MGGVEMRSITELHGLAMDLAEYAFVARLHGDLRAAEELTWRAFVYEAQAAGLLSERIDAEPNRSVLHRSAAALAIKCGDYVEAERLITTGLAGNPPGDIANELRDLLKEVQKQQGGDNDALLPQARKHPA